jgi:integrase
MLLTGARRASIVPVRREEVDLAAGVITFVHMKTSDDPMLLPLGRRLALILSARMEADAPLSSPWLWPSPTSRSGHVEEPKEDGLPSPHEYRHHARTLYIGAGVPYAESALLLGQKLPGASGGYVHAAHLVEQLRRHAQALEDVVFAARALPGFTTSAEGVLTDPLGFILVEPGREVLGQPEAILS